MNEERAHTDPELTNLYPKDINAHTQWKGGDTTIPYPLHVSVQLTTSFLVIRDTPEKEEDFG